MLVAAIILSAIILLALLRFGIIFKYNDEGSAFWLKAGFLKIRLAQTRAPKKHTPLWKRNKNIIDSIKPGSMNEFAQILKIIGKTLGRLRRRLLIKKLVLHITLAGEDPAAVALHFGAANAAFGTIMPILERNFRIKHRKFTAYADFTATEPKVYAEFSLSIAIWEVFYIIAALLPMFFTNSTLKPQSREAAKT